MYVMTDEEIWTRFRFGEIHADQNFEAPTALRSYLEDLDVLPTNLVHWHFVAGLNELHMFNGFKISLLCQLDFVVELCCCHGFDVLVYEPVVAL
mgnify:CR=1 FL=1